MRSYCGTVTELGQRSWSSIGGLEKDGNKVGENWLYDTPETIESSGRLCVGGEGR